MILGRGLGKGGPLVTAGLGLGVGLASTPEQDYGSEVRIARRRRASRDERDIRDILRLLAQATGQINS